MFLRYSSYHKNSENETAEKISRLKAFFISSYYPDTKKFQQLPCQHYIKSTDEINFNISTKHHIYDLSGRLTTTQVFMIYTCMKHKIYEINLSDKASTNCCETLLQTMSKFATIEKHAINELFPLFSNSKR